MMHAARAQCRTPAPQSAGASTAPCSRGHPRLQGSVVARAAVPFTEAPIQPVVADGQPTEFPATSGVYAVYDAAEVLQYVGISRTVSMSIAKHNQQLGDLASAARVGVLENATKDALTDAWKQWLQVRAWLQGPCRPCRHCAIEISTAVVKWSSDAIDSPTW